MTLGQALPRLIRPLGQWLSWAVLAAIREGPPNPPSAQAAATTREGPPGLTVHPSRRNPNPRRPTRQDPPHGQFFLLFPIPSARAVGAAVSRVERSDIAERRDEGAPLTRKHQLLRQ